MIFVLTIINNVNNICKNENHWSLLITRYSLLITHYSEYKHPEGCLYTKYCDNTINNCYFDSTFYSCVFIVHRIFPFISLDIQITDY